MGPLDRALQTATAWLKSEPLPAETAGESALQESTPAAEDQYVGAKAAQNGAVGIAAYAGAVVGGADAIEASSLLARAERFAGRSLQEIGRGRAAPNVDALRAHFELAKSARSMADQLATRGAEAGALVRGTIGRAGVAGAVVGSVLSAGRNLARFKEGAIDGATAAKEIAKDALIDGAAAAGGAFVGAKAGAAIGTAVTPGVGSVAGAVIGFGVGTGIAYFGHRK